MVTVSYTRQRRITLVQASSATEKESSSEKLLARASAQVLSRLEIQLRCTQIENGWSHQDRAERLQSGKIARAWLSKLMDQSETDMNASKCLVQPAAVTAS